jgi:hypothetical protein
VAAIFVLTVVVAIFLPRRSGTINLGDETYYNQLYIGISRGQVEIILGGPAGNYSAYREWEPTHREMGLEYHHWVTDTHSLLMGFEPDGKARQIIFTGLQDMTWAEKFESVWKRLFR